METLHIFFSLLSSLAKETRHSIDGINLCVHNHIGIELCTFNVGMPHEFANREEVTTSSKGEDCKGVSARVEGYILLNSSSLAPFVNGLTASVSENRQRRGCGFRNGC